jgi:hypothetical protein
MAALRKPRRGRCQAKWLVAKVVGGDEQDVHAAISLSLQFDLRRGADPWLLAAVSIADAPVGLDTRNRLAAPRSQKWFSKCDNVTCLPKVLGRGEDEWPRHKSYRVYMRFHLAQ